MSISIDRNNSDPQQITINTNTPAIPKQKYEKVNILLAQKIWNVVRAVLTLGIWTAYQNHRFRAALMKENIPLAIQLISHGASHYVNEKQALLLINAERKEALAFLVAQLNSFQIDFSGPFDDARDMSFGNFYYRDPAAEGISQAADITRKSWLNEIYQQYRKVDDPNGFEVPADHIY